MIFYLFFFGVVKKVAVVKMNCEICSSDSSVDSVMWTCAGCPRKFHASCAGINVQRNSLRRREKAIDVTAYILPCCSSCQNLVTASFEFNSLIEEQSRLAEQINKNTEVIHRNSMHHNNTDMIHEAVDRLEVLLADIKKELTVTRSGSAGVRNHITALFDMAMQAQKENLSTTIKTTTAGIADELRCMNQEVKRLGKLTSEVAVFSSVPSTPVLELDILDELKTISSNINTMDARMQSYSLPSLDSLQSEIAAQNIQTNSSDEAVKSGWRLLGNKKVWKADWTEYDERQLRRRKQQKQVEKARRRRQQNQRDHRIHAGMNYCNIAQNRRMDYGVNQSTINDGLRLLTNSRNRNNSLPPDRELLAAAKDQFSRLPPTNRPAIQFQRGEILYPYISQPNVAYQPATFQRSVIHQPAPSSIPCEACTCQHSSFQRNGRTP